MPLWCSKYFVVCVSNNVRSRWTVTEQVAKIILYGHLTLAPIPTTSHTQNVCIIVWDDMIKTAEFKKQIGKTLGQEMRELGFKGSGFDYSMDSINFVFTIGIQASRYGGQCCAELGIQPKSLDTNGTRKIDFKKIKYIDCEFRTRLSPSGHGDNWWEYGDNESGNKKVIGKIIDTIKKQAMPVIERFKNNPNILEQIEISDLENLHNGTSTNLQGLNLMTTEIRLAWALTKAVEKTNLVKAKEFAKYGLSKSKLPSTFFGIEYFEEVLSKNNGA